MKCWRRPLPPTWSAARSGIRSVSFRSPLSARRNSSIRIGILIALPWGNTSVSLTPNRSLLVTSTTASPTTPDAASATR